jgi:hypothetical protein
LAAGPPVPQAFTATTRKIQKRAIGFGKKQFLKKRSNNATRFGPGPRKFVTAAWHFGGGFQAARSTTNSTRETKNRMFETTFAEPKGSIRREK